MGLANQITLFRILLVPGIVASLIYYDPSRDGLRWVTLGLFVLGVISDAVDGYVARTRKLHSKLGTLLDPIADKCLILGTLISLSAIDGLPTWMRIPAWFNLIVISRDALLIAGGMVLFATKNHWAITPNLLGKWTTAMQMIVVVSVLLRLPFQDFLLGFTALLTVFSGLLYIRSGVRMLA